MPERSPKELWDTALGQLELQVTRPNFDTWLRNTIGLRFEDVTLVVGAPTDFAIEWLRSRMSAQIARTVSRIAGRETPVSFEVIGAPTIAPSSPPNATLPAPFSLEPDPRLTFDSFVTAESNRIAYRSALRFIDQPNACSPLVLYGAPGLGKTHLLHAIAHAVRAAGHNAVLLTATEFVNRYAASVRSGQPHLFRDGFLGCDVLLVDDIQFLASRLGSQEQFFNIFNSLHAAHKRVAVASNAPPDSTGLSSHLRSRLNAGLAIELKLPAPPDRRRLLDAKRTAMRNPVDDSVLAAVAELPCTSVRDLEGALNRIDMYAEAHGSPVTIETLRDALTPFHDHHRPPTAQQILEVVCAHFHISQHDLAGGSRSRDITYARHITMYLLRNDAHHSLTEIGRLLGNRNHATVISGCKRIDADLKNYHPVQQDLAQLRAALNGRTKAG